MRAHTHTQTQTNKQNAHTNEMVQIMKLWNKGSISHHIYDV